MTGQEPAAPRDELLEAFWVRARTRAKINPLEVLVGQDDSSALCPAAFCFGDTRELADSLCQKVVDGQKKATSSWLEAYDHEEIPVPESGELAIVCDGSGEPRALIRTTSVDIVSFGDVDDDVATDEGLASLQEWAAAHREFFTAECERLGLAFHEDGKVVVERFEVLYAPAG